MVPDVSLLLGAVAALLAVLAMIALAAFLARLGGFAPRRIGQSRTLAVEEAISLDARRRLLVVRCNDGRFLLLTGGSQDLVVGWLRRDEPKPCDDAERLEGNHEGDAHRPGIGRRSGAVR